MRTALTYNSKIRFSCAINEISNSDIIAKGEVLLAICLKYVFSCTNLCNNAPAIFATTNRLITHLRHSFVSKSSKCQVKTCWFQLLWCEDLLLFHISYCNLNNSIYLFAQLVKRNKPLTISALRPNKRCICCFFCSIFL